MCYQVSTACEVEVKADNEQILHTAQKSYCPMQGCFCNTVDHLVLSNTMAISALQASKHAGCRRGQGVR